MVTKSMGFVREWPFEKVLYKGVVELSTGSGELRS